MTSHPRQPQSDWPQNLKKTAPRLHLLDLLQKTDRPLDAGCLARLLQEKGLRVSPSTVYRNLELFEQAGLVESLHLPDTDQVFYVYRREKHLHYALCLGCHHLIPLSSCPLTPDLHVSGDPHFQLTGHKIELYGLCSHCLSQGLTPEALGHTHCIHNLEEK